MIFFDIRYSTNTKMIYPFYDSFENGFVYRGTYSLYRDYYDYPCEDEEDEEEAPEDYDELELDGYSPINSFNLVKFLMR
jgi:hypothetical protein